ncbi:hypothetical protein BDV95DRAFT_494677 [Massariosphaeria phaeospora]|uniref:Uncharacterized protein n=1 Tax=Massariosphaeria phaeospora TaxID=100035 RepID=A0A7C8I7K8_9PLEO|nr:hypothetical protein BDV95DRAFT_494677 [Massariosphaeria phaeospora]
MPDSAATAFPASSPFATADVDGRDRAALAAPPLPHGAHSADSAPAAIAPPTVTPATTTTVISTFWGASTVSAGSPHSSALPDPTLPAIIAHAPSPNAQEPPSDLATSAGSVPSTTTTLTNTLPPIQSAALRALNAPAFQSRASSTAKSKPAKSTSSRTTLSSQPVVVRTYSGSRHNSRPASGLHAPRQFLNMNRHAPQHPSALSAGLGGRQQTLPQIEDFSFSAILRAVDPEIRDAIDAIAEICARSRTSLADEYDAHLPPQGEITSTDQEWASGVGSLVGRGRISRVGQGWTAAENTLTAVPEASSSSERLAGENKGNTVGGSNKRSRSAYGSLKSVISGGSGKRKASATDIIQNTDPDLSRLDEQQPQGPAWAVNTSSSSSHPAITLVSSPQASKQLSLDISSTIKDIPEPAEGKFQQRPQTAVPKQQARNNRHISMNSLPSRARSSTISSLASWLSWARPTDPELLTPEDSTKAQVRLREVLILSQSSGFGKGKVSADAA